MINSKTYKERVMRNIMQFRIINLSYNVLIFETYKLQCACYFIAFIESSGVLEKDSINASTL